MREPRWVSRILSRPCSSTRSRAMAAWPDCATRGRWRAHSPAQGTGSRSVEIRILQHSPRPMPSVARDHPFQDGDKRIAFLTAVVFLGLNGYELEVSDEDVMANFVALAAGRLSEARLAAWIRRHIRPASAGAA